MGLHSKQSWNRGRSEQSKGYPGYASAKDREISKWFPWVFELHSPFHIPSYGDL